MHILWSTARSWLTCKQQHRWDKTLCGSFRFTWCKACPPHIWSSGIWGDNFFTFCRLPSFFFLLLLSWPVISRIPLLPLVISKIPLLSPSELNIPLKWPVISRIPLFSPSKLYIPLFLRFSLTWHSKSSLSCYDGEKVELLNLQSIFFSW